MVGIMDQKLARRMEQIFADDLSSSVEITLDGWRNRSWLSRLRTHVALPFNAQY
jgi:hypothetical protein